MPDNNETLEGILNSTSAATLSRNQRFASAFSRFKYSPPIGRSGDMLNQNFLGIGRFGASFKPTFTIDEPRERINVFARRIADQLSADLSRIEPMPDLGAAVRRLSVEQLLAGTTPGSDNNALLEGIQQSNTAGALTTATEQLNAKTITPTDRFLLSRPGIYHYLLFLLNQGMNITDEEVLVGNIITALRRIKRYVNVRLVEAILNAKHLESEFELPILQGNLRNRNLPYEGNRIEEVVLAEFEQVSRGGPLLQDVIDFLNDNEVPIPEEVGREQLIEGMVNFLRGLGIEDLSLGGDDTAGSSDDGGESPGGGTTDGGDSAPGSGGETTLSPDPTLAPQDDFEVGLKGIGPGKASDLYDAGIRTFGQLALMTPTDLGEIIEAAIGYSLESYIEQARLISQGKFAELIEYQSGLDVR